MYSVVNEHFHTWRKLFCCALVISFYGLNCTVSTCACNNEAFFPRNIEPTKTFFVPAHLHYPGSRLLINICIYLCHYVSYPWCFQHCHKDNCIEVCMTNVYVQDNTGVGICDLKICNKWCSFLTKEQYK